MADDLLWPKGTPPSEPLAQQHADLPHQSSTPFASERDAAAREVRSLLPASLRLGTGPATAALAALLRPGERPVSLVSGHIAGERLGRRSRLLLVTDQGFALTDLKGASAAAWRWQDVDTFSTRNSNPASYALDWMTFSVLRSTSCMYVIRLKDGTRMSLVNIGPQRRGFMVGRRIAWYVRKSKLSAGALADSEQVQEALQRAGKLGKSLKARAQAVTARSPNPDPPEDGSDVLDDAVTDDDVLAHLAALHEAGVLSEAEVREKAAAVTRTAQ